MALDQLKGFLLRLQDDEALKQSVLAASTADDVAKIAGGLGYSFNWDELLRFSGNRVGRVTVQAGDAWGIQLIQVQIF